MGLAARMGVELASDGDTGVDGVMELTDQMLDAVAGGCDGREPLPNAAEKSYDK